MISRVVDRDAEASAMKRGHGGACAAGMLAFSLAVVGCSHAAPVTRRVTVVVNEAGDPSQARVSELRRRYIPEGDFQVGYEETTGLSIGDASPAPSSTSSTTLSWEVSASDVADLLPRLRAEPYVKEVSVSG